MTQRGYATSGDATMLTTEELTNVKQQVLHGLPQELLRQPEFLWAVEDLVARTIRSRPADQQPSRLETALTELAEAQQRTEERVGRLEDAVERLAEAQTRTEARIEELAEAQLRTEARVEELAEAQRRTEERLQEVVELQHWLVDRVGSMKGQLLEFTYRDKASAYFGRWIRRPEVVPINDLWDTLESRLPEEGFDDILLLDLVVRGRPRACPDRVEDVYLAVEVSCVMDREDVERAERRAGWLRQAGYVAVPVVAGETATEKAKMDALCAGVAMVRDGARLYWDKAIAKWLDAAPEPSGG